jgi:hypothetical protein
LPRATEEENNNAVKASPASEMGTTAAVAKSKKGSTKRLMLHDDNIVTTTNSDGSGNKMRSVGEIDTAMVTISGLKSLPTKTDNDPPLPSPTDSSSSGGSGHTPKDSPANSDGFDDGGDEFQDVDFKTDEMIKGGEAYGNKPPSQFCGVGRSRCILYALIFIGLCLILGTIVVSLRATENLGYGQKGLIAAFHVTSSPSASPSEVPSAEPSGKS